MEILKNKVGGRKLINASLAKGKSAFVKMMSSHIVLNLLFAMLRCFYNLSPLFITF